MENRKEIKWNVIRGLETLRHAFDGVTEACQSFGRAMARPRDKEGAKKDAGGKKHENSLK